MIGRDRLCLEGDSGETYAGRFVWRIDNFTRLKDLLKKRKITGLCIKSRRHGPIVCSRTLPLNPKP